MKSLIIIAAMVAYAVAADGNSGTAARPEKRQIPSYNVGGSGVVQHPPPSPAPQPTPGNNVPPTTVPYQPNYLPVCVLQPYNGNPIYVNPASVPAYQPAEPYIPSYQPSQYPAPAYQPPQYPVPPYQPSQYPVVYQPSQYPVVYQPQQPQSPAPYSYSYFTASNNAPANVQSSKK